MLSQSTIRNEEDPTNDDSLSIGKGDLFYLLQNNRRRAVLRYFAAHSDHEVFEMRTVAEAVAAWENEITVGQLTSDERKPVYISLYQTHLPNLDEYDVIEYNQSRGVIKPTQLSILFEPYLDAGFESVSRDQRITISEDRLSFNGTTIRSLLNR